MRGRGTVAALAAALIAAGSPAAAQSPRVGLGFGGGTILGSRLLDHAFEATVDGEARALTQRVDLADLGVASAHAEWYVTRHLALRGHAAWGTGRLEVVTFAETAGDIDAAALETGFGDVGVRAFDAGVSLWPWTPRTVGFAPFVTVGYGTVRFDFEDAGEDAFFRAGGARDRGAIMVGFGADMRIWNAVTLRLEATNHMTDSPIDAADFAIAGARRLSASETLSGRTSNVRLVLGAHLYLPLGESFRLPE